MRKPVTLRQKQRTPRTFSKVQSESSIRYISDENGNLTGVIVPIELWRKIESEEETAYLLKSDTMKRRLLEAKKRQEGIPFEEVCKKLGI